MDVTLKLVVRDDGPWPYDESGMRYKGFSVQLPGEPARPIFVQGRTFWFVGAEETVNMSLRLPSARCTNPVVFTAVDAVGNTTTKSFNLKWPDIVKPRPGRPSITGTMRAGSTATCTPLVAIGGATGRTSFQWKKNGRVIPRAIARMLRLTPAMVRGRVTCTVTVRNSAGSGSATSLPRTVIAPPRR